MVCNNLNAYYSNLTQNCCRSYKFSVRWRSNSTLSSSTVAWRSATNDQCFGCRLNMTGKFNYRNNLNPYAIKAEIIVK